MCKRDVQYFIGVLNFHRDHIPKFALVAKPLYDIMGPFATFRWGTEQEKAFDELRQKLMEAPVLAYPNSENLFILDTDALNHAIGAELLQVQNGVERLIGFVIDSAQRNLYFQERATSGGAIYQAFQTLPFGTTFYYED